MFKPQSDILPRETGVINSFGGYNRNIRIPENEFFDETNISSDCYPVFSPRRKRAKFSVSGDNLQALAGKTELAYINNGKLWYGGTEVAGPVFPDIQGERQCVSMGARLIVFPDKVYVNTADLTDYGSLEAEFSTVSGTSVTFSMCRADGTLYEGYTVSASGPASPSDGDLWVDTSGVTHTLKQYSEYGGMWVEIETTYVRISTPNIGKSFKLYDAVTISGSDNDSFNGTHILRGKGDDYLVVTGISDTALTQTNPLTVERRVPDMDYVCESANRLWGCSSSNNEIYASKLGDPTNFYCYMGLSTDSYAVSVGTDGEFTGAKSFRGNVLFFKENCIHKLYGVNPPYSMTTAFVRGVQKGSSRSLVTVNETLYYKSPNGICTYEGSVPLSLSDPFGGVYYYNAVGGAFRDKYFVSMSSESGARTLFTFDERKRLWHKEDNSDVKEFCTHNSNLYYIAADGDTKSLYIADSENAFGNFTGSLSGWQQEQKVSWSAETGLWGLDNPYNKYYSGIIIRLIASENSQIEVYFQYNSDGKWIKKLSKSIGKTMSLRLPFQTPRCDHLKIRLCGTGDVKILSIARSAETGSGVNV